MDWLPVILKLGIFNSLHCLFLTEYKNFIIQWTHTNCLVITSNVYLISSEVAVGFTPIQNYPHLSQTTSFVNSSDSR